MSKVKVAFVSNTLGYGGVEKYVVRIANNLNRDLFVPVIFCFRENGPLKKEIASDVVVHEIPKKKGNDLFLPFRFARVLQEERIDIIHSNNWSTMMESAVARMIAGVNTLIHAQHGIEMNDHEAVVTWKRFQRNRLRQLSANFCSKIVAVSQATRSFICQEWHTPVTKVELIYNGVDCTAFSDAADHANRFKAAQGIAGDALIVGSVGRLMPVKNYPLLLRALHLALLQNSSLHLVLVGDGPQRNELTGLIRTLGLQGKVTLLGQRDDVKDLLKIMDIFVLPSISEGVSLALLEAMAAGLPIIATEVGGNPEVVVHGRTGTLVPSDDDEALCRALLELIDKPSLRAEMSRQGRKRLEEKFSFSRMIGTYEELYLSFSKGAE